MATYSIYAPTIIGVRTNKSVPITVQRTGDSSAAGSVNVLASPSSIYTPSAQGYDDRLLFNFAPGETTKTVNLELLPGLKLEYLNLALVEPHPSSETVGGNVHAELAIIENNTVIPYFLSKTPGTLYARMLQVDPQGFEYSLYMPVSAPPTGSGTATGSGTSTSSPTSTRTPTSSPTSPAPSPGVRIIGANGVTSKAAGNTVTVGFAPGQDGEVPVWQGDRYVASPITDSFPPGTQEGDTFYWDGTEWITAAPTPPQMPTGVNGIAVTTDPETGETTIGLEDGANPGDVPVWDGSEWAIAPAPTSTQTLMGSEGVTVTEADGSTTIGLPPGTQENDVLLWNGTEFAPGSVVSGLPPGATKGDTITWDGEQWIAAPASSQSINGAQGITVTPNPDSPELTDIGLPPGSLATDVLIWNGDSEYAPGSVLTALPAGTQEGDTPYWDGTEWIITSPTQTSQEITGTEGITVTTDPDTNATAIGLPPGEEIGQFLMWDGTNYVPATFTVNGGQI